VLLSSHELDEVDRVCDRVGIVRAGRLIAVERVADLLAKAQRRNLVNVEFAEPEEVRAMPRVVKAEFAHATLEEVFLTFTERGEA
jgi:ABC-2 type transport system ATP-binding protein